MRIASLVLGAVGVLLGGAVFILFSFELWIWIGAAGLVCALAGFITGAMAKAKARREQGEVDKVANAGFIVSLIGLVEYVVILLMIGYFLLPAACAAAAGV